MISLFSRKKDDPYKIQGSGYGSNYASNASNYKPPATPTVSSMQRAVFPTNPVSQPSYFSKPATVPQMSQAPKTYQGSGMTSNYASNPTNYKPVTPPPAPTKPTYTPTPLDTQTQAITDYLKRMGEQTNQRVDETNATAKTNADLLAQRYDLAGQAIKGQSGTLTDIFNRFKGNTEADIADVAALAESQKQQAKDYYGEANRTAAQARQETGQQATRKFAGQGAIDSAGAGSYQEANANIDSEFNRVVAQNASALAAKQMEVDTAVGQYQRQAKTMIADEESKLNQALQQIEIQFADNEIGKQQAVNQVYQAAQDRVYTIQDTLSQIEQQALEQKQNIALELQKLDASKLSPEFMATGKPTNQAEYDYLVQNADKFKTLGLLGDQANGNQNKALTMVNNLLKQDTKGITGFSRTGNIPGLAQLTGANTTQADYDGLKNLLALAERGQLKGSGAVSDFEAKMLEKAAMAGLNQNLSDGEFRRRLELLQQDLMAGGATATNMSMANGGQQSGMVRVVSPTGETGMMDASELQAALASGWRQV